MILNSIEPPLNSKSINGHSRANGRTRTRLRPHSPQAASISFRFHARDLHLVLGPAADGKPVRFRVTLDGLAPGADHGLDTDADGYGVVTENRLYQLVRQHSQYS